MWYRMNYVFLFFHFPLNLILLFLPCLKRLVAVTHHRNRCQSSYTIFSFFSTLFGDLYKVPWWPVIQTELRIASPCSFKLSYGFRLFSSRTEIIMCHHLNGTLTHISFLCHKLPLELSNSTMKSSRLISWHMKLCKELSVFSVTCTSSCMMTAWKIILIWNPSKIPIRSLLLLSCKIFSPVVSGLT